VSVTRVGLGSRVHSEVLREVARHREGLATRYAHMNTRFIRPQLHLSAVVDLFLRLFAGGSCRRRAALEFRLRCRSLSLHPESA